MIYALTGNDYSAQFEQCMGDNEEIFNDWFTAFTDFTHGHVIQGVLEFISFCTKISDASFEACSDDPQMRADLAAVNTYIETCGGAGDQC